MGILTRFKDIMSANINALLDKCEDPEKMIDQYMRNLESDLGKVKAETASVMAEETRAKRELDECTEQINKMQAYAEKALKAGNESDARSFLEKKQQLATGTPADWLTETHAVCEKIYEDTPEDSELSYQYMFDNYPVVEQQLLRAGLRLADILNSIYK